jgi:DNA-directed RNA polymerase specialized sigma24 family protein
VLDLDLKKELMERTVNSSEVNPTEFAELMPCLNHLIDACKENDLKAQLYLYKLYYKEMFNLSLRIVKDIILAEDIMQESFLVAFEKIGSCSGISSFDSRLKKIVESQSLNTLNKKLSSCS